MPGSSPEARGRLIGRGFRIGWVLAGLLLAWALAAPALAAAPEKVCVQLLWVHQAQFAGIYMAQDRGLYAAAGLEVKVEQGGPGVASLSRLNNQNCDFALAWLTAGIEARGKGQHLVNLAQLVQRSGMLLVAHADSGIEKVADLNHRRVALWDSYFSLSTKAMLKKEGIKVEEVRQGVSMALLLNRAVAASSAMIYNEYHRLYQAGMNWDEMVVLSLAELGFNFPEDGIYALETTWKNRPDTCRRFVQATLEGWRLALEQPDEALKSVMRRINQAKLASNQSHQKWMLKNFVRLLVPDKKGAPMGRLAVSDYDLVTRRLLEEGFVENCPGYDNFAMPAWKPAP